MNAYKPKQRTVQADILTEAGWFSGKFHLPIKNRFVDFINHTHDFMPLTDVAIKRADGTDEMVEFFSIQRRTIILVLPESTAESEMVRLPHFESKNLHCITTVGTIHGNVEIVHGIRTSDYLMNQHGFVSMYSGLLGLYPAYSADHIAQSQPAIILNTQHIVGMTDTLPDSDQ